MWKRIAVQIVVCLVLFCNFRYPVCGEDNGKENKNNALFEISSREACLMEANSGMVIFEKDANTKVSPASITKIMTLLIIYDELDSGKIKKEDIVTTSAYAKSMGGSQVFLEEGEQQSIETMIKCIVIASGNDASVAMAEHIAGTEEAFVARMNERAEKLGMNNTHFVDCCGLTDSDEHYSCARDVAIMSRELITRYPDILNYSSIWMETIIHKTDKGEKEFILSNTNKLLKASEYVKGLKTGSTSKAKYCVSVVGEKNGVLIISVIMGAPDHKIRFKEASNMLNYGFANCRVFHDKSEERQYEYNVTKGKKSVGKCCLKEDFNYSTVDNMNFNDVKVEKSINNVNAPVKKGDIVGSVVYKYNGVVLGEKPLVSMEGIDETNYFNELKRIFSNMLMIKVD